MDDLHKRYVDKRFVALKEDYEVETFEKDVKKKLPNVTSHDIHLALIDAASHYPSNHPRQRLLDHMIVVLA